MGIDTRRIEGIYCRHAHHLLPYIGAAYTAPRSDDLRVLALGINAYVSPGDWPPKPEWFRGWIRERRDRYQKGLAKEVRAIAESVLGSRMFGDLTFDVTRSVYATNAVKVYVPEDRGKRAADLTDADFAAHIDQWHDELKSLGEAGVMPHVIVVLGKVCWPFAWQAFHPDHYGPGQRVVEFESVWGDAPHRLNRVVVDHGQPHQLLVVRLRHPSRAGGTGTAKWLVKTQAFRETVGAE